MISAMYYITVGVFEHIENTLVMDVNIRIKDTESILREPVKNKYRQVMDECKE